MNVIERVILKPKFALTTDEEANARQMDILIRHRDMSNADPRTSTPGKKPMRAQENHQPHQIWHCILLIYRNHRAVSGNAEKSTPKRVNNPGSQVGSFSFVTAYNSTTWMEPNPVTSADTLLVDSLILKLTNSG